MGPATKAVSWHANTLSKGHGAPASHVLQEPPTTPTPTPTHPPLPSGQELLEHPFLRPTQAPAAAAAPKPGSSVELSREQLTKLLQQVAAAGVSGSDVGHLSDQLFKQLSHGLSPDLVSRKAAAAEARTAAAGSAAAHPAPAAQPSPRAASQAHPQQQQQQQQPGSVAAAAAQAAAARSGQRADAVAALESRPRAAAAAAGSRAVLMPISQSAIAQQAAALRKVEPAAKQPAQRQPESGLEAALRKGEGRVGQGVVGQGVGCIGGWSGWQGGTLPPAGRQVRSLDQMLACLSPTTVRLTFPLPRPCTGLERFKFEDATAGEEDGNTTGGF